LVCFTPWEKPYTKWQKWHNSLDTNFKCTVYKMMWEYIHLTYSIGMKYTIMPKIDLHDFC
jgi:hypothetical protein